MSCGRVPDVPVSWRMVLDVLVWIVLDVPRSWRMGLDVLVRIVLDVPVSWMMVLDVPVSCRVVLILMPQ